MLQVLFEKNYNMKIYTIIATIALVISIYNNYMFITHLCDKIWFETTETGCMQVIEIDGDENTVFPIQFTVDMTIENRFLK